jgi:hypothetical protein
MPVSHPRSWRRDSLFGAGPRRPLDREQRARFRFLLNAHRRVGRLTRAGKDVGEALVKRLGVDGQLDPSHDTLAGDAGCSDRTVRRALDAMKALGLVIWQRRLVRTGWRTEQTSNAYLLALTENPPPIQPVRCGGHSVRQTRSDMIHNSMSMPSAAEVAEAQAALAQRRAVIEARLLTRGR